MVVTVILGFSLLITGTAFFVLARYLLQIRESQSQFQESWVQLLRQNREDVVQQVSNTLRTQQEGNAHLHAQFQTSQKHQWDLFYTQLVTLTQTLDSKLEAVKQTLETRLQGLQQGNEKKLDEMRATVDEKLHATLEKRLGESFQLVSERLEGVHKGLGEMQALASGVGDLKKVLTNVKTRGIWGEVQLASLLEQMLSPDQYQSNVKTKKNSSEFVEFAVKLPGRDDGGTIWLPIDAKFPQETYLKLLDAQDQADKVAVEDLSKLLEAQIKIQAKSIREKYIDPPHTTDFAILFLPIEGLYAEVLRRTGLQEVLSSQKVMIAGPTNLAALLNSLQMGFRTLAIEKRSGEVWTLLSSVKTEFSKFGDALEKTQKKLVEAGNSIDLAAQKSRSIERKLRNVQELPAPEIEVLLPGMVEVKEREGELE